MPPFSFGWSPFRLLWVAGLGRRFERPNTGQRNRRGLSAAADALKPPIELSRLNLMGWGPFCASRPSLYQPQHSVSFDNSHISNRAF